MIPAEEDFALTLNGKKNKIDADDFAPFRAYLNIPEKAVKDKYLDKKSVFIEQITQSELIQKEKESMINIVEERFKRMG